MFYGWARLREKGYQVFHDVVGENFNLDHVVMGPYGIFTVETKTRSKPVNGSPGIVFNDEGLIINGAKPDQKPVIQAKAQSC